MVRVKICGITTVEEATLAERLGANAIGLLVGQVHHSEDFISATTAASICKSLSPFITSVLVTHLTSLEEILDLTTYVPATAIQIHSNLNGQSLREIKNKLSPFRKIIGKVSITDNSAIDRAKEIAPYVDAIVLDSIDTSSNRVGGTGKTHDWEISAKIVQEVHCRVILAGGLNPDNVRDAIIRVRPWAVDAHTGLEFPDGTKDPDKIRKFIEAASARDKH
jgi:phosphoribosylanthranilate isomerase